MRKNYRDRECLKCGNAFRGTNNHCKRCLATDRACVTCGRTFRGTELRCAVCRYTDRTCLSCGKGYRGGGRQCRQCQYKARDCTQCGTPIRGTNTRCWQCRVRGRECSECGRSYLGCHLKCPACFMPERICRDCGRTFKGTNQRCTTCAFKRLPLDAQKAMRARWLYTRRARKRAAQVAGPVPLTVYMQVLTSGACVYCGGAAGTVDHITPLARGGHEAGYNLAPACLPCNQSKSDRFLTEWKPQRVKYALEHSMIVNTEYRRWRAETGQVQ